MSIFQAVVLGVVQGITEFLPISSQAHLLLVPYFLKWNYQGLGFDIALHWGTLLGVLAFFGKDYWNILTGKMGSKMFWYLVLGSIPAAAAGFLFEKQAETIFRSPLITVFTLAGFGFLLWLADRNPSLNPSPRQESEVLNWKKVLGIGLAQAIAIIPGVSRSGATITAGLFSGLSREAAARFSFLLSGPIIFGAGLVASRDLVSITAPLIAGFLAAAIAGFLAIEFLLRYVSKNNFNVFVWYRLVLAVAVLLTILYR
ncbi:MAG: undecaprenyl-diphosphate phosphatase [Candidatus Doudnabacteria bacterium]|nr:undecaprenyl-diphosphate phosphatase [Candidatus Doudnabacteria bacterium]